MWAMTSFGILMPAIRPPHTVSPKDPRTMQIRSRRAKDLDILRARYMQGTLGPNIHTPEKDYEFRAYCRPHDFAVAMAQMVLEIDYLKFKPTTERFADNPLHTTYNRIWGVVSAEMSDKHWSKWPAATKASSGKTNGAGSGKTNGAKHSHSSIQTTGKASGTGYPIASSRPAADDLDDRWGPLADPYVSWSSKESYSTAADRDSYEPEVWDGEVTGVADDKLLAEIDEIIDAQAPQDEPPHNHEGCTHAASADARASCRRRYKRARRMRADNIRQAVRDTFKGKARSSPRAIGSAN